MKCLSLETEKINLSQELMTSNEEVVSLKDQLKIIIDLAVAQLAGLGVILIHVITKRSVNFI